MTSRAETPLPDLVANRSDAAAVSRDGDLRRPAVRRLAV